jgi:threonyl-tRNA synthetase
MEKKIKTHQEIGNEQSLYMIHEFSSGSIFFLPHGQRIYNKLVETIRHEYKKRDFLEVGTPNLFNIKLWKQSGHFDNYFKNMFSLNIDEETYSLKPMNCPSHCLIFLNKNRSYKELPMRLADFGVLHRNEASGALTGLTRVRKFSQDDAHIFCREEQVPKEVNECLKFLSDIYHKFGFTFQVALSTRPEKYIGEIELWDRAEKALEDCLKESKLDYVISDKDGAFYGPKIDIQLKDALGRSHQCGTIQLDFQLPINFKLRYLDEKSEYKTPVIIHRAILGSVERMMAILMEHYQGKWPFWLSPRQIKIVVVADKFADYAKQVAELLKEKFYVDLDVSADPLKAKIQNAQLEQYNYIFVIGEKEQNAKTVNIRTDAGQVLGEKPVSELITYLASL